MVRTTAESIDERCLRVRAGLRARAAGAEYDAGQLEARIAFAYARYAEAVSSGREARTEFARRILDGRLADAERFIEQTTADRELIAA
jgi:hypothetical protein